MAAAKDFGNEDDDWDPMDHPTMRRRIEDGAVEEFTRMFPQEYGNVRLEASDIHLAGKEHFTNAEQKKALLENRTLVRPLKANLALYDKTTGELLEERPKVTLMRVPYYTNRGTFVHNGNDYTGTTMQRMMPGAFTRIQNNGGLEAQFNVRPGTGRAFRVGMDQETGQFRFKVAGSNLHLYSMLRDLGVGEKDIEDAWGPEVAEMNRAKYDVRTFGKAYAKLVPTYLQTPKPDIETQKQAIFDSLKKAQISKEVVKRTLAAYWKERAPEKLAKTEFNRLLMNLLDRPEKKAAAIDTFDVRNRMGDVDDEGDEYQSVDVDGLLAASRKLLAINKGLDVPDERHIPAFSKLYPMDKLMRERIRLDDGKLRRNLMRMVSARKSLAPLANRAFDPYYVDIITKSSLTTPLEETNPLQLIGQHRRVTVMGPGGIGSDDAITPEMQSIAASGFGFFSPLEGPECFTYASEVYTLRGWTPWPEVRDDDTFACRVEGRLEWHKASRIVRDQYTGPIIVGEHETIRMAVTPTHRVLNTRDVNYRIDLAQDVMGRGIKIPIRHEPYLGDPSFLEFHLPEIPVTNNAQKQFKPVEITDWCRLIGWWLSEGSSVSAERNRGNRWACTERKLRITQCPVANPAQHQEIHELLVRLGFRRPSSAVRNRLSFQGKQLTSYFSQWSSGCYDKWIPDNLFEAPIPAREALLDALLKGDGRYNKKRWCYCTVSRRLAESVERLAISLGYTAFIREEKDSREHVTTTNYVVSIHRQKHRQLMACSYLDTRWDPPRAYGNNWSVEDYEGVVYCATVPGGLLHVRGKKSTSGFWSGNSSRSGVDVRMAWDTKIGKDGRIRKPLLDRRTGKIVMTSPQDLYGKFLKLPD
jgi:hypothetical protein